MNPNLFGVYIHWPFCLSKCPYCDFNSHVRDAIDTRLWQESLLKDLRAAHPETSHKKVTSIFFGGGTPSTMPPKLVATLIDEVHKLWPVADDIEITLEANPTSVEQQNFKALSKAGVNRVSLGIQSLNDKDLAFLGRTHSAKEAHKAITTAQENFQRYSFDFIYTLPHQTLSAWEKELETIIKLGAQHLSLYQLTIEKGTPFYLHHARGDFSMKTDDQSATFFEKTREMTQAAGFDAYEVSNFSASKKETCKHNLTYWHADDYVGIGPGAHGRFYKNNQRCFERRHRSPDKWLQDVKEKNTGVHVSHTMPRADQVEEILMMGLRLKTGVSLPDFYKKTGHPLAEAFHPQALEILVKEKLLYQSDTCLKATNTGLQKLNGVLSFLFNYAENKTA